jgi:hypothetical protein
VKHFIRHYIEMVIAMFAGMVVLGAPAELAADALGYEPSDALELLGMAVTMTIPMVAWMRFRGHTWQPCLEMSAAMLAPTFVAMALLPWVEYMTLMGFEHVAMLLAMLGAMLARPAEYMHHHAHA